MVFYSLKKSKRDAHHHWANQLLSFYWILHTERKKKDGHKPHPLLFLFYFLRCSFLFTFLSLPFLCWLCAFLRPPLLPSLYLFTLVLSLFFFTSLFIFLFLSMTKLTIAKYSSLDEMFPIISRAFESLVPSSWCCLGGLGVWPCWRK